MRTYSELIKATTFEERYDYLRLGGSVGKDTFGFDRYLNQMLYRTPEWKKCRRDVIIRDNGCDLGVDDYELHGSIYVHHMNPITKDEVLNWHPKIFNPEYLITTSFNTHNAIHYGDSGLLITKPMERSKNDTCPWR